MRCTLTTRKVDLCPRFGADHWIHAALTSDREHCKRGFWQAAAAK